MTPPHRRRVAVLSAAVVAGTVAAAAIARGFGDPSPMWALTVGGFVLSLLVVGTVAALRPLRDRLGRFTAVVAVCTCWGVIFAAVAFVSAAPYTEIASFALFGFLVPLTVVIGFAPAVAAVAAVRGLWRRYVTRRPAWGLYRRLGVTPDASPTQLRRAAKSLRAAARRAGDERMADAVTEAFDVLSDPELRAAYDASLRHRLTRRRAVSVHPAQEG